MPQNYKFSFQKNGKYIYVPTEDCTKRGLALVEFCLAQVCFPPHFFHYRKGGHIAALHEHIQRRFFFRIDIQNFFYSISRNRVGAALHSINSPSPRSNAKWSCVKNPYQLPTYSVPIGFVQSPVLASLALLRSPIQQAIDDAINKGIFISVYFDDIIGSGNSLPQVQQSYDAILEAFAVSNFVSNEGKQEAPARTIVAFNCDISEGCAEVSEERITKFFATDKPADAIDAFEQYRLRVSSQNERPAPL